jgi:outer membrane protein OmpA-like peptidoglycan-associated protein
MVESSIIGSKFTEETDVPLWQEFLMSKLNITVFLVIFFLFNPALAAINTNAEKGVLRTLSAQTYGKAKLNFGAGISFNQSSDYFKGKVKKGSLDSVRLNGQGIPNSELDPAQLFSSNIFVAIGLLSFWDLSISLPFYYDWAGITNVRDGGIGDLDISTKFSVPTQNKVFKQGYLISGTVPVGMRKNGLFPRHPYYLENQSINPAQSFYSAKSPTLKMQALLTFDIGEVVSKLPLIAHVNLGGVMAVSRENQRNTVVGGFALEYNPLEFLTVFTDLYAESRWSNFATNLTPTSDPVIFSPGIKIKVPTGMYLVFSGDFSLSSRALSNRLNWKPESGGGKGYEYSTGVIPRYGAQFIIGWDGFVTVQDDDKDGIKNDEDRCPRDPEDIDGFEDDDGCPDPDNDKDGIPDLKDKCPNEAEDKDGFEDEDGCPDPDNDGDGIPDLKDQCPNAPEDFDGFEDRDGCPDFDNDKDGIVDSLDKCPNEPEDFDGFQDDDGCPDLDNDNDGIPDIRDKCPNEPEVFNNYMDDDGCPDSVKKEADIPKQQILKGIVFRSNSPEMTFESYQYLEPLIRQLKQYPEVEIEIRGYTDSVGDGAKNMQLSQMRAESVRQYLGSKGIELHRIRAVGFGASSPIADNRTAAGRAQNRRIEIIRLK